MKKLNNSLNQGHVNLPMICQNNASLWPILSAKTALARSANCGKKNTHAKYEPINSESEET